MQDCLDYLKLLIHTPSVVGSERPFILTLTRELEALGIKVFSYYGLLVAEGANPKSHIICAHVDRHGLMTTGPNEFQYAAFITRYQSSDHDGKSVSEQTYRNVSNRFVGNEVIAYDPWGGAYLGRGTITDSFYCELRDNLIFSIPDLSNLPTGCPIAYSPKLKIENNLISAQLDNIISVALIVALYKNGYQGTAFFTSREETGSSWRFIQNYLRYTKQEDRLLIDLDTSPFPTLEAASNQDIVLRKKDNNAEFNHNLTEEIVEICKSHNISYCFKDEYIDFQNKIRQEENLNPLSYGSTQLGRLIKGGNGKMTGSTIQIPTFDYHTNNETTLITSLQATYRLLKTFLK